MAKITLISRSHRRHTSNILCCKNLYTPQSSLSLDDVTYVVMVTCEGAPCPSSLPHLQFVPNACQLMSVIIMSEAEEAKWRTTSTSESPSSSFLLLSQATLDGVPTDLLRIFIDTRVYPSSSISICPSRTLQTHLIAGGPLMTVTLTQYLQIAKHHTQRSHCGSKLSNWIKKNANMVQRDLVCLSDTVKPQSQWPTGWKSHGSLANN